MEDRQRAEGRREVLERVYSIEYKYLLTFQYFQYSESNNSRSRVQHIHVIVEEVDSRRVVAHRATPSCVLAFGYQVIAKGLQYGCLRPPASTCCSRSPILESWEAFGSRPSPQNSDVSCLVNLVHR